MPSRIDPAVRERALRMFADHRRDYPSDTALAVAVAAKLGVCRPRRCRPGPTSGGPSPGLTAQPEPP
jgi:transposase